MPINLIIGRDGATSQLSISDGQAAKTFGPVPNTVSRKHMQLTVNVDRTCVVTNINPQNTTLVDGLSVNSMAVKWGARVELGQDKFPLDWTCVEQMLPKLIDITSLRPVWEKYSADQLAIRQRQLRVGQLAAIPGAFTMGGIILTGLLPSDKRWFAYTLTGIALAITLYGAYLKLTDKSLKQQEDLRNRLIASYKCPECGHFMGFQDYVILAQGNACPWCKTKYGKK